MLSTLSRKVLNASSYMIHPCFGKRFTVYQLNVQAATAEKEKHQPFRNIFFLRAPFSAKSF